MLVTITRQQATPKTCTITYNPNKNNQTSLVMPAAESAIIFAYHELINELAKKQTTGAWIIDAEHIDGRYKVHNGIYQFSASRYYLIDDQLHSFTVELLGLYEFSTDLSTIAVKLNKNGRANSVVYKTLSTDSLIKDGAARVANQINQLVADMIYAVYNIKACDINLKEMDFDVDIIKSNFIERFYPETAAQHITDIDVIGFKANRGVHTVYAKYNFKNKSQTTSFHLNQYLLLETDKSKQVGF